ncbi:MAG: glycosyltransferase [Candidatus Methanomethyliaceae archaeon]
MERLRGGAGSLRDTVLEALACGTPVVATAVGGIPEQVKSLEHRARSKEHKSMGPEEATGILVKKGNAEGMAEAIVALLADDALRMQLGHNAAKDAQKRFDLSRQVETYLSWYEEILAGVESENKQWARQERNSKSMGQMAKR